MKYFPNNLTTVPLAISASITSRSALINNFAGTPINTASLALNITGSRGSSGISYLVVGPTGPQGPIGPMGPPGDGIYMLPASRTVCGCFTYTTFATATAPIDPEVNYTCGTPNNTYYSPSDTIGAGITLYTVPECQTTTVSNGFYAYNDNVYQASAGVLTFVGICLSI